MSGEYELKKDRDRLFWQGGFLWSGQDYIGEPTPYDQFPVKASFFGAVDTAGFPKDAYHLFDSQWDGTPMVHLVPMNWTDHQPGQDVEVWVYANVATVELRLNGRSLGTKSFDRKVTTFGRPYLETTEPTDDDDNYPSGSYTSPNGSTGKLHLTWTVPFEPGTLAAIATENGREVARDELVTAGPARSLRLRPDKQVLAADGTSLSHVTAEIVDARGRLVPHADNPIHFTVSGPAADRHRQRPRGERDRLHVADHGRLQRAGAGGRRVDQEGRCHPAHRRRRGPAEGGGHAGFRGPGQARHPPYPGPPRVPPRPRGRRQAGRPQPRPPPGPPRTPATRARRPPCPP